jgi:hypothetical protein
MELIIQLSRRTMAILEAAFGMIATTTYPIEI